jgi:DNA-directed RNA polymerase subunit M/transcription elongation factor TFIIS
MSRLQPDTIRPDCPKCGTVMLLARSVPDILGHDLHTFECPMCEHSVQERDGQNDRLSDQRERA